jgi:hypothetical protein
MPRFLSSDPEEEIIAAWNAVHRIAVADGLRCITALRVDHVESP